jgi:hypothetical protein
VPEVQAEIGGDNRFVEFANETHVVGEGDSYGCASSIIQAFVTDPAALWSLSTSCAAAIPSIRAVGSYPGSLRSVTPVTLTSGRASSARGDQLTLTNDELVPGVRVSGTVTIGATTVTADLRVAADGVAGLRLAGSWPLYGVRRRPP